MPSCFNNRGKKITWKFFSVKVSGSSVVKVVVVTVVDVIVVEVVVVSWFRFLLPRRAACRFGLSIVQIIWVQIYWETKTNRNKIKQLKTVTLKSNPFLGTDSQNSQRFPKFHTCWSASSLYLLVVMRYELVGGWFWNDIIQWLFKNLTKFGIRK